MSDRLVVGCDGCPVRDVQCDDCFVTLLSGDPGAGVPPPLEQRALAVLAAAGMISDRVAVLVPLPLRRAG